MEEDKEALHQKLALTTPHNANSLASSCVQQAETIRQSIFLMERTISLLPLMSSPSYPDGLIPPRQEILQYIMKPAILSSQEATPTFIQHSALFVSFIHTKPEIFAKVVIKRYAMPDFHFLVYSVIPSFYGFFTSYEHVQLAANFYISVLKVALPHISIAILQPYFCSLITFRFIESVMTQFMKKFGTDGRLEDKNRQKTLIPQFSSELVALIIDSISLLPNQILAIFKILSKLKWKYSDVSDLFFKHFFNQQSLVWVASSPYGHRTQLFNVILKDVVKNQSNITQIYKTLISTESKFEIPACYKVLEQPYMLLLLSAADILAASRCFETQEQLPFTLKDANYDIFTIETIYKPFWVRIFPKGLSRPTDTDSPIVFPKREQYPLTEGLDYDRPYRQIEAIMDPSYSSVYEFITDQNANQTMDQIRKILGSNFDSFKDYALKHSLNDLFNRGKDFENLLTFTMHLRIISEWHELCISKQTALLTPIALKATKTAIIKYPSLPRAFKCASHHFSNKKLQALQFICVVEDEMAKSLEKEQNICQEFSKLWTNQCTEIMNSLDSPVPNALPPSSQYMFWESIEELRALSKVSLNRKYEVLLQTLLKLTLIAQKSTTYDVYLTAFVMTESTQIPILFALFNSFLVRNPQFTLLTTFQEKYIWDLLEKFLSDFTHRSQELFQTYAQLQNAFEKLCGNERETFENATFSDSDSSSGAWNLIQQQLLRSAK